MELDRRTKKSVSVKLRLAERYDRLSADARSRDKRIHYWRKAEKHRQQARETLRDATTTPVVDPRARGGHCGSLRST